MCCLHDELLVHLSVPGLDDLLLHGHGPGRLHIKGQSQEISENKF